MRIGLSHTIAPKLLALLPLALVVTAGCSPTASSGPSSVAENSTARENLADRVRFIEQYVTFRRQYQKLDYAVRYQNNDGGMVPGPSDWDIRLLAVVPQKDVAVWIPGGATKQKRPAPKWLRDLPGAIPKDGITEWYRQSGIDVGIDRARSIIAYRNTTNPDTE